MGEKIKIKKISKVPKQEVEDVDFTEEVNNIVDESKSGEDTVASETINLDEQQSHTIENVEVDFMDEDYLNNFAEKQTKEVPEEKGSNVFDEGTTEGLRQQILTEEKIKSESFSPKDMRQIAEFLINIFDSGIGMALKAWSGDSSMTAYQLDKPTKSQLTDQLTLILIKHGAKFKIEVLFIVGLCLAYAPQFKKAYDKRQDIKKVVQQQKPVQQNNNTETNSNQSQETTRDIIKRKQGRPRKR